MTDGTDASSRPRRTTRRLSRRPIRARGHQVSGVDDAPEEDLDLDEGDLLEEGAGTGERVIADDTTDGLEPDPDTDPRIVAPRSAGGGVGDDDRTLPRVPVREAVRAAAGEYEEFGGAANVPAPAVSTAASSPTAGELPAPVAERSASEPVEPVVVVRRAHIISDSPRVSTSEAERPVTVPQIRAPIEVPAMPAVPAPVSAPAREAPADARQAPPPPVPVAALAHSPVPPPVPMSPAPRVAPPPPVPASVGAGVSAPAAALGPLGDASQAAGLRDLALRPVEVDVVIDDGEAASAGETADALRLDATSGADPERVSTRRSGAPPPPPEAAKAARKPPPPPRPTRVDDMVAQARARQWWERFFSDDYLMSVLPPAPAQVARQVDFVESSLGLVRGGTVLDVGCGLGLHARELALRGYLVVGLDLSLPMITRAAEDAQQQNLRINFLHTDIREIQFDGAFDGVICLGTTFGFFDDDSNRDVLARLYQGLKPGGRILIDVVNRDHVIASQPNLIWFQGDGCVCMEESDFNYFNSRLTVKRTMMQEDGQQSEAEYSVRLYSLHELGQLMQQMGFRVMEVSGQEATRGMFFGTHSQRILMLAERRSMQRMSTALGTERRTSEAPLPLPPKREG